MIVHLGGEFDPISDVARSRRVNVDATRRMLEAATELGIRRVVNLSSAVVYGAWSNHPAFIDEQHVLRPNPGFEPALELAAVEQLMADWRASDPARRVVCLRTAVVGASGVDHLAARLAVGIPPLFVRGATPRLQLVHVDDLARAVLHAIEPTRDGVYNVACDGALGAAEVQKFTGRRALPALPRELVERITAKGWNLGVIDLPPRGVPMLIHPPVLDNQALRATGWTPTQTNVEVLQALVDTHRVELRRLRIAVWAVTVLAGMKLALFAAVTGWLLSRWYRSIPRRRA